MSVQKLLPKQLDDLLRQEASGKSLVLWGANQTGLCVHQALNHLEQWKVSQWLDQSVQSSLGVPVLKPEQARLDAQKEALLLCADPKHYEQMKTEAQKLYPEVKVIALLEHVQIRKSIQSLVRPTYDICIDPDFRQVKWIVESLPRSGTQFITKSLAEACGGVVAHFQANDAMSSEVYRHRIYPELLYSRQPIGPVVVFSHFNRPASHHLTERVPVIYPLSFPLDGIWSIAKHRYLTTKALKANYWDPFYLSWDCEEWQFYKSIHQSEGFTYRHWFQMIAGQKERILRLEDWLLDKSINLSKLQAFDPALKTTHFEVDEQHLAKRLYFAKDYAQRMDRKVFDWLYDYYQNIIESLWPEALPALEDVRGSWSKL